jgi:HSP20 family protein
MKEQLSIGNGNGFPRLLRRMRHDFDRLFEEGWPVLAADDSLAEVAFQPSVDVTEDKDQVLVRAELPGMAKDDIKVSVDGGVLSIQGEKKENKETREGGVLRRESSYGSFCRSFTLPAGVDAGKAAASYRDGVLELKLPKKEEAKPKAIEIALK